MDIEKSRVAQTIVDTVLLCVAAAKAKVASTIGMSEEAARAWIPILIFAVGDAYRGGTSSGHRKGRLSPFTKECTNLLQRYGMVWFVDEFYTSQLCVVCWCRWVEGKGKPGQRARTCATTGCLGHVPDKDATAALSLALLCLRFLCGQKRPQQFQPKSHARDEDVDEADIDDETMDELAQAQPSGWRFVINGRSPRSSVLNSTSGADQSASVSSKGPAGESTRASTSDAPPIRKRVPVLDDANKPTKVPKKNKNVPVADVQQQENVTGKTRPRSSSVDEAEDMATKRPRNVSDMDGGAALERVEGDGGDVGGGGGGGGEGGGGGGGERFKIIIRRPRGREREGEGGIINGRAMDGSGAAKEEMGE